jgi:alpha-galactosidase
MTDLALCDQLTGTLCLYDIDLPAAKRNVKVGKEVFSHPDARTTFKVTATDDLATALKGADFIFLSIQPGPLTMFANDLDIPLKHGILQTVGDTTGPGGISRSLRAIPIYFDFAHEIMKHCPDAWVINYTNPMTLCTRALYAAEPEIKAFGCCHEVFGTQSMLARLVEKHLEVDKPDRREIKVDVSGVNHFTWVTEATWGGRELFDLVDKEIGEPGFFDDLTEWSEKTLAEEKYFNNCSRIKYDLYRRFGVLGAAGDRHLVEFVPWYLSGGTETLHRWGVVATPSSFRLALHDIKNTPKDQAKAEATKKGASEDALHHTGEEGIDQMLAILGRGDLDTNVNLPNMGQIAELPLGCVVETNAQFRRDSVRPITSNPLPDPVFMLVYRVVAVQEMTLQAAMEKDFDLALAATLNDPLVNIPTDRAAMMMRELLQANKDMMRGWKL